MTKTLNLSSWQRFKHELYKTGRCAEMAAEEIGTTEMALRQRIYAGLKRPDGKRTPLDEKIVKFIEENKLDFDVS
ncbi:hypothetical protein [Hydrogenimonas urashimensis]|uniref:hypothetical protein n=1 Tax=Hydrogenimonas urashimensis TaxID=2740515 RepID=UPI00191696EC|nr:hypothetical protein [Hydrogenimonas urashimensis]